jgi:hypothetical protein
MGASSMTAGNWILPTIWMNLEEDPKLRMRMQLDFYLDFNFMRSWAESLATQFSDFWLTAL